MKLTLTPSKKSNESDTSTDNDVRIHEGSSYQANIPVLNCLPTSTDHDAILFWKPTDLVSDDELLKYLNYARRKHRMNEEQALAILQICKYKVNTSQLLMEQYAPENDEWSVEEKFLFEQAYKFYGKTFSRIRQMLPEKTISELVRYYYSWKKTRLYKSLMDKHEKQCQLMPYDEDEESDEEERNTTSVPIPTKDLDHRSKATSAIDSTIDEDQECCNCEIQCESTHSTPKGILCDECFAYWQKSGLMRPELYRSKPVVKKIKRPPKNMSVDIKTLTSTTLDDALDKLEEDIRNEWSIIQSHNQTIELLTNQSREGIDAMQIPFLTSDLNSTDTTTSTWSTEEILLAIQAFAKYGKDFATVARLIGSTKTVDDVETFFLECRERYQLDMVIDTYSKSNSNVQKKADEIVFVNSI
ncbi:unnamed protein product [Adineta ricciae]|uniref:REST corepressor n=1 Tax=Adineta ricciae TaxID=249248 RepID=A0A814X9A5_ADIRI|nr:unnamed protein product [Adineta ricciae]